MISEIDILRIKLAQYYVGIDYNEVVKLIPLKEDVNYSEKGENYYLLGELFGISETIDYDSIVIVNSKKSGKIIFAIPNQYDVISIRTEEIMNITDYVKKRQNPFFIWGILNREETMIRLFTFSYFNTGKKENG